MITETEFVETVNIIKASNLMRAKGVVEKMYQEIIKLREEVETMKKVSLPEGDNDAKPSANTKSK